MPNTNSENRSDATQLQQRVYRAMQMRERPNGSVQEKNSFSLASARGNAYEDTSGHVGSVTDDDMMIQKEQTIPEDGQENSTESRLQNLAGTPHGMMAQFYF